MIHTPVKMVNTRSTARREQQKKVEDEQRENTNRDLQMPVQMENKNKTIDLDVGSVVKSEVPKMDDPKPHCSRKTTTQGSKKSSSSSIVARRRKLELEAAEAKARIQMDLIDKKLQADLAELDDDEYSPPTEASEGSVKSDVARWVERSQQELVSQFAPETGNDKGSLCPPAAVVADTDGPVQQLANALKEIVTASVSNTQNTNLLSRLSTPRELPIFFGEPMEWLQFKAAYEESTRVCKFSDTENLWRLRKCLRGPAKDAVNALLVSATSPDILLSTLELQFGNSDAILSRIIYDIKKLNTMSPDYHKDIIVFSNKIKNYVAAVRALKCEEYLQEMSLVTIILSKLPTILLSKWADYSYARIKEEKTSKFDLLANFLHEEALKISKCSVTFLNLNQRPDNFKRKYYDSKNDSNTHTVLVQSGASDQKCRYCRMSKHDLTECKRFKKALRKDRWQHVKKFGLCYKCLLSHHDRQSCAAAACDVEGCGESHHRLLHYVPGQSSRQNNTNLVPVTESEAQTETVTHINIGKCAVLLKVVPINIHGPNGIISTTALLDDGSTVTLISASLAERAGLRGRRECLRVRGAWDSTELVCETQLIDFSLSNINGTIFSISACSVSNLNLPVQDLSLVRCENYKYLHKIQGLLCNNTVKPEMLIGQDNYNLLAPLEVVTGGSNDPCATRTPLGWCLHGRIPRHVTSHTDIHSTLHILRHEDENEIDNNAILQEMQADVRRYFTIDSMGISAEPRQNSENVRAQEHLEQTSELIGGQWHVELPWRNQDCVMVDSFPNALSRLKGVEFKFQKNNDYAKRYIERIQHLLNNNYAEKLQGPVDSSKTWYLPHFGVDNPNKKKLRLVFDCAAKTKGLSLNDYLYTGPDLLMSLMGIMFRFRENEVAVTGDIKDMFLRIKIKPNDQHALRFLYRDKPDDPVDTYLMTSLIFGANCSPFIAQFVKNKNARRFESSMPAAVNAIYTQHYMDDYIDSLPDEETAKQLIRDVTYIHAQGDFEIRNWNTNRKNVIRDVPNETLGDMAVRFKIGQQREYAGERTLGLLWQPDEDTLGFDVSLKKIPEDIVLGKQRPTKRDILRIIMSIFDVYGFLAPFTINGKLLLQETWKINLSWDEQIPDNIYRKWLKWISQLKSISEVRLPRHYHVAASASETGKHLSGASGMQTGSVINAPGPAQEPVLSAPGCYSNLELHIFCDASILSICAVAYWRWIMNDVVHQAFIASKARVATVKPISVPRLELQACVLAARLCDTIIKEHRIKPERRIFWSDSTTVLHWIRNDARNYKCYVAHRLGEIDNLTQMNEWRYVPTGLNIADFATRETYDRSILPTEWIKGPSFLLKCESEWPKDILSAEINTGELICALTTTEIKTNLPTPEPTRFSSWLRLLRSCCNMLKFINRCKRTKEDDAAVMEKAERLLLRYSQAKSFPEEILKIKNNELIPKTSKLLTLSPYIDEYDVLRVGGRIDAAADVLPETKRPVILDGRDYITRLLVKSYHVNAAHENQETVVNNLRQKYWILKLRPTVKNISSKCMICRIRKCKPEVPRMGDLPKARIAHHQRPFTFCGVDLFGPLEVTVGRRREKRYGVLFTCLTVRAIHLEVVATLTTDSLIMALRRMAARRGWPQQIFSDNGTNLRGADTELKRAIHELDDIILMSEAANRETKWTFIPAASPHWGGAWERLIRSVKNSLKIILRERAPREETFNTLMAEVENIVNSRPLTHVAVDPGSKETLTPNHFLMGSSSNCPHMGVFDDSEFYLRKQWRIAQRLADLYWKRWVKEVLPDLIPRKKWHEEQRPLQVGDLVLVVDPNGPRNTWPRGIVKHVHPGTDGRVRMVQIKTKGSVLTRSAARVARIPISDECC